MYIEEKKLNIFVFDRWMFERYVSDNYVKIMMVVLLFF